MSQQGERRYPGNRQGRGRPKKAVSIDETPVAVEEALVTVETPDAAEDPAVVEEGSKKVRGRQKKEVEIELKPKNGRAQKTKGGWIDQVLI